MIRNQQLGGNSRRARRARIALTITAAALAQAACSAAVPPFPRLPPPPSEQVRADLGAVGVLARREPPEAVRVAGPGVWSMGSPGSGTAVDAAARLGFRGERVPTSADVAHDTLGVAGAVSAGGTAFGGFLAIPVLIGGFAATGMLAAGAALGAEPAAVVAEREAQFKAVVRTLPVQELLRDRIAAAAPDIVGREVAVLTSTSPPPVGGRGAVLEVGIEEVAVHDFGWLLLAVRSRLLDARSGAVLHELRLSYVGRAPRSLKEWLDDGARALRQEIDAARAPLAEKILEEVFLVYSLGEGQP